MKADMCVEAIPKTLFLPSQEELTQRDTYPSIDEYTNLAPLPRHSLTHTRLSILTNLLILAQP